MKKSEPRAVYAGIDGEQLQRAANSFKRLLWIFLVRHALARESVSAHFWQR
jgi:hypothetical protein